MCKQVSKNELADSLFGNSGLYFLMFWINSFILVLASFANKSSILFLDASNSLFLPQNLPLTLYLPSLPK